MGINQAIYPSAQRDDIHGKHHIEWILRLCVNKASVLKFLSHSPTSLSRDIIDLITNDFDKFLRIVGLLASDLINGHCGKVRINFSLPESPLQQRFASLEQNPIHH